MSWRKLPLVAMTLVLAVACATLADAQERQGRGGGRGFGGMRGGFGGTASTSLRLLRQEAVQKELNLSDSQKQSAEKIAVTADEDIQDIYVDLRDVSPEERATKMPELRAKSEARAKEAQKELEGVLEVKQIERLKQLAVQRIGLGALEDADVAAALKLSDDQKKQLATVREESMRKMRELFESAAQGDDREAMREKRQKLSEEMNEQAMTVLTSEQRDEFSKMQGAKFEFPRGPGGFGGPGGGGGGRRNRGDN